MDWYLKGEKLTIDNSALESSSQTGLVLPNLPIL